MSAAAEMLCAGVRAALLAWVRQRYGRERAREMGTSGCCTLAALAAAEVLRSAGLRCEVAWGAFLGLPHTWLLLPPEHATVPEQLGAYGVFFDLTADQFLDEAPPVAIVEPGHPMRGAYQLSAWGPEAELEVACPYASADAAHAKEVVAAFYERSGLEPGQRVIAVGAGA